MLLIADQATFHVKGLWPAIMSEVPSTAVWVKSEVQEEILETETETLNHARPNSESVPHYSK